MKVFKSNKAKEQALKSYDHLLNLWGINLTEVDIDTKYGVTHCILSGNKTNPPLLMFHGVGDNSAVMWMLNIKELSKYYFCIAVDTIGGPGKSIPNDNFKRGRFNQVDWINEVAQHLQILNYNIVGVSNGAYMAYNYLVDNKEKVRKVVCLEGGMIIGSPIKSMVKTIFLLFPQILIPNKKNIIAIMKKLSSPNSSFFHQYPEIVDHMILLMKGHNQKAMFVHSLEKYDKEKAVQVKEKLFFLLGGYKIEQKMAFTSVLDDGEFKYRIIDGAGHGINLEQPETVNEEIISFLIH